MQNGKTENKEGIELLHRGSNQSGMRAYNERLVLTLVRRSGALSKTAIAQKTGLSAQTVSVIMRALEADGLLERGEPVRGNVGQPSIPMSLASKGAYFFGLKLGRRSSDLVLTDFMGTVIGQKHHTYDYPLPADIIDFTREAAAELTELLPKTRRGRIAGLGIGMPFELWNWAELVGAPSAAIDVWRNIDMQAEVGALFDFPVYLQNDASAACGAELVFGTLPDLQDFLYFFIGFFIGGGITLQGSIYTGSSGNAGALGSMPVPDGRGGICQLIDIASLSTLQSMLGIPEQLSSQQWDRPEDLPVDEDILRSWVGNAARALAYAIVSASAVIDVQDALIDGWLPLPVRASLVEATRACLADLNLSGVTAPRLREGTIGHNARALGAASLPLSQRFLVHRNAVMKES